MTIAPSLHLHFLGLPRIEADGQTAQLDTRKAIALLAYLAVNDEAYTRDTLAALFWPDSDQAHARAALRRTLSALNRALGPHYIQADRHTVGLAAEAQLWLDVTQFTGLVNKSLAHDHGATSGRAEVCRRCIADLSAAVKLYEGDFMQGFSLRDSVGFDEWQFFQSEHLRQQFGRALERLVDLLIPAGETETAIDHARRWLALDTLHEPAHRRLMQLYAWTGQHAAAVRQYRECERILDEELGVAPLAETRDAYEAILEHRLEQPAARTSSGLQAPAPELVHASSRLQTPPVTQPFRFPLVGRDRDLATLLQAYAEVEASNRSPELVRAGGRLLVIAGEAGIGKTRLAEEFLAHLQPVGADGIRPDGAHPDGPSPAVLAVTCYEGEGNLAYGPIVEAIRGVLSDAASIARLGALRSGSADPIAETRQPAAAATAPTASRGSYILSETSRLIPELADLFPDLAPPRLLADPGAQSRFFDALAQVLFALIAGPRPGILFLDDVQWADDASLDLLLYLVRRLHRQPWCILVTWRDEDIGPQSPDTTRPLDAAAERVQRMVSAARRAGRATTITLRRLPAAAVSTLVNTLLPGATQPALPDRAAPEDGVDLGERLYQETEGLPFFLVEYLAELRRQEQPGFEHWLMPATVRDLLHARLARAGEVAHQVLAAGAVIGRSFDYDTVRLASGRSDEETIAALEELSAQGLVMELAGDAGAPAYDFNHERLRSVVYEEISRPRRRLLHRRVAEAIAQRARGRRAAGSLAAQIGHHYRLAGDDSLAAEFYAQAGEHARTLFANTEALAHFQTALSLGHAQAPGLHMAVGDLLTLAGDYGAALTAYAQTAAGASMEEKSDLEARMADVYHRRGEWQLAEDHYQAALELGAPPAKAAHILARWSLNAHRRGDGERALTLAQQALDLAADAGDDRGLAEAHNMLGILAHSAGDLATAASHLERSLALAESLHDPQGQVAALNNLALVRAANGEIDRALDLVGDALEVCTRIGDLHRQAALHNHMADLLHAVGRKAQAREHQVQAVKLFAAVAEEGAGWQPEIWKLVSW